MITLENADKEVCGKGVFMTRGKKNKALKLLLLSFLSLCGYQTAFSAAVPAPKPKAATKDAANDATTKKSTALENEAKVRKAQKKSGAQDRKEVDFDNADISGSARNPFNSLLSSREQENPGEFVRLRKHWHDQLILSVSGLSQ